MIEHVRILKDWFADATNGINARLAGLTIDAGDTAPPSLGQILDDSRTGIVARRRWPQGQSLPALLVWNAGVTWPGGKTTGIRDGTCVVGCTLLLAETETEEGLEDIGYLDRALRNAVDDLSDSANQASRTRNNLLLTDIDGVEETPAEPWIEDVLVAADYRVTWKVRDTAP